MSLILVVAALLCIAGESLGLRDVVYAAKPTATLAIIAIAVRSAPAISTRYRTSVVLGLLASLAGDVFLMLPGDRFVAGLACFLVAHLFYIAAFAGDGGGRRDPEAASLVAAVAVAMVALLWSGLGDMRIPVIAYVGVIATMAWQALARWRNIGGEPAALAAAGSVAFLVSDSALAIRRFRVEFPFATAVVLSTYWAAQWAIARSVRAAPVRTAEHPAVAESSA